MLTSLGKILVFKESCKLFKKFTKYQLPQYFKNKKPLKHEIYQTKTVHNYENKGNKSRGILLGQIPSENMMMCKSKFIHWKTNEEIYRHYAIVTSYTANSTFQLHKKSMTILLFKWPNS